MNHDDIIDQLKKIAKQNPGTGRANAVLMTLRGIYAALRISKPEMIDWEGIVEIYGLKEVPSQTECAIQESLGYSLMYLNDKPLWAKNVTLDGQPLKICKETNHD